MGGGPQPPVLWSWRVLESVAQAGGRGRVHLSAFLPWEEVRGRAAHAARCGAAPRLPWGESAALLSAGPGAGRGRGLRRGNAVAGRAPSSSPPVFGRSRRSRCGGSLLDPSSRRLWSLLYFVKPARGCLGRSASPLLLGPLPSATVSWGGLPLPASPPCSATGGGLPACASEQAALAHGTQRSPTPRTPRPKQSTQWFTRILRLLPTERPRCAGACSRCW